MSAATSILDRIRDYARERRLRALTRRMKAAAECGDDLAKRRALWAQFRDEHEHRSAAQVARMEKRMFR